MSNADQDFTFNIKKKIGEAAFLKSGRELLPVSLSVEFSRVTSHVQVGNVSLGITSWQTDWCSTCSGQSNGLLYECGSTWHRENLSV